MRLGHRNIEWFVIASLVVITITIFLIYPAVQLNLGPQVITTTITNTILLMILAALLVIIIIQLRIFGELTEIKKKR